MSFRMEHKMRQEMKACLWALFGLAFVGHAKAEEGAAQRWHFYAGPAWRTGMKIDAKGGSAAPADGWVRPDGTGAGSTLDWGVNNAGQIHIDPDLVWGGNIYTLHISDGGASPVSRDNLDAFGATMALTYDLAIRDTFRIGARLGMAGYWGLRQDLDGITYGNIYLMPSGDLIYGGGGPPLVSSGNPLVDSEVLLDPVGSFQAGGTHLTVRSDFYQFALGPELTWSPIQRLRLSFTPAVLLNLANLRMSSEASNGVGQIGTADGSATEFLVGCGLQGGISYDLTERLGIGGMVGYEWIQDASVDCGPTRIGIDYSAVTVSVGLTLSF